MAISGGKHCSRVLVPWPGLQALTIPLPFIFFLALDCMREREREGGVVGRVEIGRMALQDTMGTE